jgi:hypothetical protein
MIQLAATASMSLAGRWRGRLRRAWTRQLPARGPPISRPGDRGQVRREFRELLERTTVGSMRLFFEDEGFDGPGRDVV